MKNIVIAASVLALLASCKPLARQEAVSEDKIVSARLLARIINLISKSRKNTTLAVKEVGNSSSNRELYDSLVNLGSVVDKVRNDYVKQFDNSIKQHIDEHGGISNGAKELLKKEISTDYYHWANNLNDELREMLTNNSTYQKNKPWILYSSWSERRSQSLQSLLQNLKQKIYRLPEFSTLSP